MTPAGAQRHAALWRDGLVSPAGVVPLVERLRDFVGPSQDAVAPEAGQPLGPSPSRGGGPMDHASMPRPARRGSMSNAWACTRASAPRPGRSARGARGGWAKASLTWGPPRGSAPASPAASRSAARRRAGGRGQGGAPRPGRPLARRGIHGVRHAARSCRARLPLSAARSLGAGAATASGRPRARGGAVAHTARAGPGNARRVGRDSPPRLGGR
jgi:translation initiation factor IF-2